MPENYKVNFRTKINEFKRKHNKLVSAIENGEIGGGTEVVANPTLAGTEASLTSLQVGNAKYKVGGGSSSGKKLYLHIFLGTSYVRYRAGYGLNISYDGTDITATPITVGTDSSGRIIIISTNPEKYTSFDDIKNKKEGIVVMGFAGYPAQSVADIYAYVSGFGNGVMLANRTIALQNSFTVYGMEAPIGTTFMFYNDVKEL